MKRRARVPRLAQAPRLAQQQADFTSEGSPPPGWVADAPPVTTGTTLTPATPAAPRRDVEAVPPAATAKPKH